MTKKNLNNIKLFNTKLMNSPLLKKQSNNAPHNSAIDFITNPYKNIKGTSAHLSKPLTIPSSVKQWSNSIYSYNKNFIRNLPTIDNIINKLINTYFSINPVPAGLNNSKGKKSKLQVRRFNRLSLNKILTGKSEIKHFNDHVFITVFIFNKKKNTLLHKLKNLYNKMLFGINNQNFNKKSLFKSYKKNRITKSSVKLFKPFKKNGAKHSLYLLNLALETRKNLELKLGNKLLLSNYFDNKRSNNTEAVENPLNFHIANILHDKPQALKAVLNKKNLLKQRFLASYIRKYDHLHFKSINIKKISYLDRLNSLKKKFVSNFDTNNFCLLKTHFNIIPWCAIKRTKFLVQNLSNMSQTMNPYLISKKKYSLYKFYDQLASIAFDSYREQHQYKINYKYSKDNMLIKVNNYKNLKRVAANSMHIFYKYYEKKTTSTIYNIIINHYVNSINKYKLNKYTTNEELITIFPMDLKIVLQKTNLQHLSGSPAMLFETKHQSDHVLGSSQWSNGKNMANNLSYSSLEKLKAFYLLTSSYSSIDTLLLNKSLPNQNSFTANNLEKKESTMKKLYTYNLMFTYKILKKYLKNKQSDNFAQLGLIYKEKVPNILTPIDPYINILETLKAKYIMDSKNLNSKDPLSSMAANDRGSSKVLYMVKKKLDKIENFFISYRCLINKTYYQNLGTRHVSTDLFITIEKNVIDKFKMDLLKQILTREFMYIGYLKLVSFNNNLFKDWFLSKLKTLISRVYNKKVILNFISLKYIYMNSAIFTQALAIRLRNHRVNRLGKVLYRAFKQISTASVTRETNDIFSPISVYIENNLKKKSFLHNELFKGPGSPQDFNTNSKKDYNKNNNPVFENFNTQSTLYDFKPINLTIKRLNQLQANTIHFIKYKSVFGIRIEATGRLTKRSTASRSISKVVYKGSLKHNEYLNKTQSTVLVKNNNISNLQYTIVNSKTRNGSFGLKGWITSN